MTGLSCGMPEAAPIVSVPPALGVALVDALASAVVAGGDGAGPPVVCTSDEPLPHAASAVAAMIGRGTARRRFMVLLLEMMWGERGCAGAAGGETGPRSR